MPWATGVGVAVSWVVGWSLALRLSLLGGKRGISLVVLGEGGKGTEVGMEKEVGRDGDEDGESKVECCGVLWSVQRSKEQKKRAVGESCTFWQSPCWRLCGLRLALRAQCRRGCLGSCRPGSGWVGRVPGGRVLMPWLRSVGQLLFALWECVYMLISELFN